TQSWAPPGPLATVTVTRAPGATDVGVAEMVGAGGGGGATLFTDTPMAALVVRLPAASRATAVRLCVPFTAVVVFHEIEYGALIDSAPRFAPSSLNCTPTTPTLSAAFAV